MQKVCRKCLCSSKIVIFRFIINQNLNLETRRFAVEGLSYLTMDADVKELIVEDVNLIRSLVEVAKVSIYERERMQENLCSVAAVRACTV